MSDSSGVDAYTGGCGQWVHFKPVRQAGAQSDGMCRDHGGQEAVEEAVHAAAMVRLRSGHQHKCTRLHWVMHREGNKQARGSEGLRRTAGVRE